MIATIDGGTRMAKKRPAPEAEEERPFNPAHYRFNWHTLKALKEDVEKIRELATSLDAVVKRAAAAIGAPGAPVAPGDWELYLDGTKKCENGRATITEFIENVEVAIVKKKWRKAGSGD